MARIRLEKILDHLDHEMKKVLEKTINNLTSSAQCNRDELYREFMRQIYHEFNTWVRVSDNDIDID